MLVTVLGMVTRVSLILMLVSKSTPVPFKMDFFSSNFNGPSLISVSNAELPMLVTGNPLIVLGMVTTLRRPVYRMIVIVPLLVE